MGLLRELREVRGLRLVDIAASTGLSIGMLSLAERGLKRFGPESAQRLAEAFRVEPDVLEILLNGSGPARGRK